MAVILLMLGLAVPLSVGVPVVYAAPAITSFSPATGSPGQTLGFTIDGSGFTEPIGVSFSGSGITVTGSQAIDPTHIVGNMVIASSAACGLRDVTVSAGGSSTTKQDAFTVLRPPVVSSISQTSGDQGQTLSPVYIEGGCFLGDTDLGEVQVAFLLDGAPDPEIFVSFSVNSTKNIITASISISEEAEPGPRDLRVTAQGGSGILYGGFTVKRPPPIITSVNPTFVYRGQTKYVQIYGHYFDYMTSVSFGSGVGVIVANSMTDSWILTKVTVASNAPPGFRDVSVTTQWGSDTLSNGFSVPEGEPMIKILSPNAGTEKWEIGSVQTITWTASPGLEDNPVKIEYSVNGGSTWRTAVSRTANDGIATWTVKDHGATNRALIRIRTLLYPVVSDVSDMMFTISLPTITVLTPNGPFGQGASFQEGEKWELGTPQTITWNSSPSISYRSKVKIQISYDGGKRWKTIKSSIPNSGSYTWKEVKGKPSNQAMIKITSTSNKKVWDTSDAFFRITSPTIKLLSPNGGESWTVGTYQTIEWNSSPGLTSKIKIQISYDGGKKWKTIKSSTPNDGIEKWKVKGNPTNQAFIRVTSRSDKTVYDFSDASFSIALPTIKLLSPNGGENWTIGTYQMINWASSYGLTGKVKIEISYDGGKRWKTIKSSTPNDGTERWKVKGNPTNQAFIRVISRSYKTVYDFSDAGFSIRDY